MSIIVPLVALILLLSLILWFSFTYVRSYRSRVRVETNEAYEVVQHEFASLRKDLVKHIGMLEQANQSRELTHEEMKIFTALSKKLAHIEKHIQDEIDDIEKVTSSDESHMEKVEHDTLARYADTLQNKESTNATVIPPRAKARGASSVQTSGTHLKVVRE
jgi:hypothetical protein